MAKTDQAPAWQRGLRPDQIAYYEELIRKHRSRAVCRGSGRHQFHLNDMSLFSRGPVTGIEMIPLADGTVEVRDWCMRECGRYQSYLTDGEGTILWDTRDYGSQDRSYIAHGLDLTRADDRRVLQHLQQERLSREIARRIKIARRAVTDLQVAGEAV